jgi:hypothetical protein
MKTCRIDRIGEEAINNQGLKMRIIAYRLNRDIDVEFEDGHVHKHVSYKNFIRGAVNNPYFQSVYGIGFLGDGPYATTKEDHRLNDCYMKWVSMMERAYGVEYHSKYPTYEKCSVVPEWHNYQIFAKWYYENYYQIPGQQMQLDKDILKKGNKTYGPDACVFVPQRINKLFTKRDSCRGELPIGITYNQNENRYRAQCSNMGRNIIIGQFADIGPAFNAYKAFKETLIKSVAEQYKGYIPRVLYDALKMYEVLPND